jgi:hypothetical protein
MVELDDLLENAKKLGLNKSGTEKTQEAETKVEETKVEAEVEEKVETEPEVETQVETEEVDENNSFLDVLKDTGGKKEEVKPEVPAEFLAELETYKTKLAAIESDPLVKAVMAEATKEQLVAIAAELNGKDYSKSSYKDLMEMEIRNEGYEGDELQEQLEAVLESFDSMLDFEKKRAEKALREKFQKEAKKGESPTLASLEAAFQEKLSKQPKAEDIQKIVEVEKKEINTIGSKLLGKKLYGVEFTADTLKDIVEKEYDVNKVAEFVDKEGNLDAVSFIQSKFISKNFNKMIEWAKEEGKREANKGNAVTKGTGGRTSPVTANPVSESKKNKEGLLPQYILDQMPN